MFKINALDEDGDRVERHLTLHIRVTSGGGTLSDTLFDVMTSYVYDVQRQTFWTLGSDTALPQRLTAWLTDPAAGDATVGQPLSVSAFFHQNAERIDSFQVASNRWVAIAKGNLQYQPSTSTWRFAEHQYDYIGDSNINLTNHDYSYSNWIDLFSWATAYDPTFVPNNNNYYDNQSTVDFQDWGTHPISNGGAQMNMWRTPTFGEWNYLIKLRNNADSLYSYATVCSVHGMIVLPDNWVLPDSCSFSPKQHNWTTNVYDSIVWSRMEEAGAVFLPAAGFRCKPTSSSSTLSITQIGNAGAYWSANGHIWYSTYGFTPYQHAYRMNFFGTMGNAPNTMQSVECYYGQSVRLVRNL